MSVESAELGEFLTEARRITSIHRVCAVTLFISDGTVVEFGDAHDDGAAGGDAGGDVGGPGRTMVSEVSAGVSGALGADWPVPDLLFEIPHGATREEDYRFLRFQLSPELPEDLIDYFFVNTDVGSSELAYRVAADVAGHVSTRDSAAESTALRSVLVLRCLIPRTFIDTNRVMDRSSLSEEDGSTLSNAFADYIRTEADRETLLTLYEQYHQIAGRAHALVCQHGGLSIAPHTYAPRSVGIDSFDEGIGKALRGAYEPDLHRTWKIRPEVDFITQNVGADDDEASEQPEKLAPMDLVAAVWKRYTALGVECAENESYPLHPASMAHHYSALYPGQVFCFEIRRDLLADPFSPFAEMNISADKVGRMAGPLTEGIVEFLERQ